ncbi:MAG TPA: hypothetical protein VHY33_13195 [Thermoanaerobaculia bacterium]|jgi:hypothetical protein|nr:hypothetical protein [Thermoanaerobaculia bacterium]
MEGQTQLVCRDCGRTASVRGELPEEYTACFVEVVNREGFVPAPGDANNAFLCGRCLATYKGSETADDDQKIRR